MTNRGVDVTVAGSQKGLMLPPGLSFNVVSEKVSTVAKTAALSKVCWEWSSMIEANAINVFPYTPATQLLFGLKETMTMLMEEDLPDGDDADALRRLILERFDLSPGNGFGRRQGRVFKIGHLGWFNDLVLTGTLSGTAA